MKEGDTLTVINGPLKGSRVRILFTWGRYVEVLLNGARHCLRQNQLEDTNNA